MHEHIAAWGGKSAVAVLIRLLIIRQPLLLDETLWHLHDHSNNLITGNQIMMGFLWWCKRAQCLMFLWKLRCPTSPLKKHWNDSDKYSATPHSHMFHWDWKFPLVRRVSAADCRCCSAAEHRTQQRPERDTPAQIYTRVWFPALGVRESVPDEHHQRPSVSSASQKPRSCLGHTEMWDVSSGTMPVPDRDRGPSDEGRTYQSWHSSVNRCLILCWKLVLPGSREQRWRLSKVTPAPVPTTAITLAERKKSVFFFFFAGETECWWRGNWGAVQKCMLSTFAESIKKYIL